MQVSTKDWTAAEDGAREGVGFVPAATRDSAATWMQEHGVKLVGESSADLSTSNLNAINESVAKIPSSVMDEINQAGGGLEVIRGNGVSEHPALSNLKGVPVSPYHQGATWDMTAGAGGAPGRPTVIVGNKVVGDEYHGCSNIVIHELAHTYDNCHQGGSISQSAEWKNLHKQIQWPGAYQQDRPEEAFAESMAKYCQSPLMRASLPPAVRDYFHKTLGGTFAKK